ncbi:helix-turn-helix domain-containing protein [Catenuloplanes sp. NPDC051500]|uniref:helix-turn-helix domain-containing protein n=1 Tax=Catenuloplanes sp. NPDC051500 TaxID=3363959 RepID=UPI003799B3B9
MDGEKKDSDLPGGNPQGRRRVLGAELRGLRLGRGLTAEEAGRGIERSGSWISRIEGGKIRIRTRELNDLLDVYGVANHSRRTFLESLAIEGRQRTWWSSYRDVVGENYAVFIGLEQAAARIFEYQERVVPGLLQTESYMRALLGSYGVVSEWAVGAEQAERLVQVRLTRQELLRQPPRPALSVVIDESVVRRVVGNPDVHSAQLKALLACSEWMELRVFPFRGPVGAVAVSSFAILWAPGGTSAAYEEHLSRSALYDGPLAAPYVEMADWLVSNALSKGNSERLIMMAIKEMDRRNS